MDCKLCETRVFVTLLSRLQCWEWCLAYSRYSTNICLDERMKGWMMISTHSVGLYRPRQVRDTWHSEIISRHHHLGLFMAWHMVKQHSPGNKTEKYYQELSKMLKSPTKYTYFIYLKPVYFSSFSLPPLWSKCHHLSFYCLHSYCHTKYFLPSPGKMSLSSIWLCLSMSWALQLLPIDHRIGVQNIRVTSRDFKGRPRSASLVFPLSTPHQLSARSRLIFFQVS